MSIFVFEAGKLDCITCDDFLHIKFVTDLFCANDFNVTSVSKNCSTCSDYSEISSRCETLKELTGCYFIDTNCRSTQLCPVTKVLVQ